MTSLSTEAPQPSIPPPPSSLSPPSSSSNTLLALKHELSLISIHDDLISFITRLLTTTNFSLCSDTANFLFTLFLSNADVLPPALLATHAPLIKAEMLKQNYNYRLSSSVLCYSPALRLPATPEQIEESEHSLYCRAVDDLLPSSLISLLHDHFVTSENNYFTEHNYTDGFGGASPTPYFSYVADLKPLLNNESTVFSTLVKKVFNIAKVCSPHIESDAKYVEFWAHSRPHCSGHQMHFDSDNEGQSGEDGGPLHPLCSTVLYLTGGNTGGPTLVTPQKLTSRKLASEGWLIFPTQNRLIAFDGRVLHGVIPGRGVRPEPGDDGSKGPERRVTLMFAFWSDIRARGGNGEGFGAARAFPTGADDESSGGAGAKKWVEFMTSQYEDVDGEIRGEEKEVTPAHIDTVFADVDDSKAKVKGKGTVPFKKLRGIPEIGEVFMY